MLWCSNDVREVPMFSLIALYFQYRKTQAAAVQAEAAAIRHTSAANDAGANPMVATAA
ncbi:hypothetical protein [Sphingomonas sp. OK281]|uniref:hypothetical protein n=1 Tax=Sphingomonas sp. OK281 TaxID=1881067 RepID=UPI0008EF95E3|nr:hypothetical protein [Sphingomonas sp. OK281]SFN72296.1 hypothetical protein SAMN05428984_0391 [Sphingomonas sp. OK281]